MVFALNSNLSYISIAVHLFFVFVWYNFAHPFIFNLSVILLLLHPLYKTCGWIIVFSPMW